MGTASLHASIIEGGREPSVYPDRCRLQMERRTIAGESAATAEAEIQQLLAKLHGDDYEFSGTARLVFSRPPYETPTAHPLIGMLRVQAATQGVDSAICGMTFWTDAAVLGEAGIPSVLFGPGGAGLHSTEEFVRLAEVVACRDVLAGLVLDWLNHQR